MLHTQTVVVNNSCAMHKKNCINVLINLEISIAFGSEYNLSGCPDVCFKGDNGKHTVCPRSSDPFYIVTNNIKRVTASWTDSMANLHNTRCRFAEKWELLGAKFAHFYKEL